MSCILIRPVLMGSKKKKNFLTAVHTQKEQKDFSSPFSCKMKMDLFVAIKGEWEPPLCDVLSFKVNNENYFFTIRVAYSVERQASNLWVACSTLAIFLLFISFVEFYKCIFVENVIDFENLKTVVVIIFWNPFILVNIARCKITILSTSTRNKCNIIDNVI